MPYRKSPTERWLLLLSSNCQLGCPGCVLKSFVNQPKKNLHFTLSNLERIAPYITSAHHIEFGGGEPTLNPNFWKITETVAKKKPAFIAILTNAYALMNSPQKAKRFFNRLDKLNKETGTNFIVQASVDDIHFQTTSDKARKKAAEKVKILLGHEPDHSGVSLQFRVSLTASQYRKRNHLKLLEQFGLPPERTEIREWDSKGKASDEKRVVIAPDGNVYSSEFQLQKKAPIARLGYINFSNILKSFPKMIYTFKKEKLKKYANPKVKRIIQPKAKPKAQQKIRK